MNPTHTALFQKSKSIVGLRRVVRQSNPFVAASVDREAYRMLQDQYREEVEANDELANLEKSLYELQDEKYSLHENYSYQQD